MSTSTCLSCDRLETVGKVLNDPNQSLKNRFRALYTLRNGACDKCVEWIGKVFIDSSELIKHEAAYCLGQTQNKTAIPILLAILDDKHQEPVVRHEAGEALGAIGDSRAMSTLQKHEKDADPVVSETCEIALARIRWSEDRRARGEDGVGKSPYNSIDPAPAATEGNVAELGKTLIDTSKPLFARYRAMFALRDVNTVEAIKALAKGLHCSDSALLRHEVAYVMGQTRNPYACDELIAVLGKLDEHAIVRHECAEALGTIGADIGFKTLKKYLDDKQRIVRETAIVALSHYD